MYRPILKSPSLRPPKSGFALVIALSMMAFVVLLVLTMSTLVKVETTNASDSLKQLEAEQAALLAINIAIGKLQETAGPDQRITANADVINDSENLYTGGSDIPQGQASWVGVWRSDSLPDGSGNYSPAQPNNRSFIGWLVSGTDANGDFQLPDELTNASEDISALKEDSFVSLYKENSQNIAYAHAEKVQIGDSSDRSSFAFHVVDEASKADLSWNETPLSSTTTERYQSSRLTAAPGPDYAALNGDNQSGPFGSLSYPLTVESSDIITDINKLSDIRNLKAKIENSSQASNWILDNRTDMTWGSRGLLTDVKWGGLRRDLSLAFEMDSDAESANANNFNSQDGEFVGGNDRFSSPIQYPGMPTRARYLHRDTSGSGTTFSNDIIRGDAVLRGPTWWAMRDYANLYKRVEENGGGYSLPVRARFPNRSSGNTYYDLFQGNNNVKSYVVWDTEYESGDYIYYPATANYSPVYLGMISLLSAFPIIDEIEPSNGKLALCMDNVYYIWNPYNTKLTFDKLSLIFPLHSFPGWVRFWVQQEDGSLYDPGVARVRDFFGKNVGGNDTISLLLTDNGGGSVTMEPGEVLAFSPVTSAQQAGRVMRAEPGFAINNSSGFILEDYFAQNESISLDDDGDPLLDADGNTQQSHYRKELPFNHLTDLAGFNYIRPAPGGGERLSVQLNLAASGTNLTDLTNEANYGEELQFRYYNLAGINRDGFSVYFSDSANNSDEPVTGADNYVALSGKRYFGMLAVLQKPANFGSNDSTPLEVFELFNPRNSVYSTDQWYACAHNELIMAISSQDSNDLINNNGINIPISDNGFWGASYASNASTAVPMLNIPTSPLLSLAEFANANLSIKTADPMRIVGSSRANPYFAPTSIYGGMQTLTTNTSTTQDASWLANDALFDRYYLSGFAPDFTIGGNGYQINGSIEETLSSFYGNNYRDALANPVLTPHLPESANTEDVISELSATDGYRKIGAYSMIDGAFNVNSTSVAAWEAFLGANRDLAIDYSNGGTNTDSGIPMPSGKSPVSPTIAENHWSGFARLNSNEITNLATRIVEQVKLRGPFMSISDFVNHRVGQPLNNQTHYSGTLQAAIDLADINGDLRGGSAGGTTPNYPSEAFPSMPDLGNRDTSSGIAGDVTQAGLLLSLAPRLTARSDTFTIRAYGEAESELSDSRATTAICEAVVQRLPQYVDQTDEPWDEATDPLNPSVSNLASLNQTFGRQFKIVRFRWLSEDEI